MSLIIKAIKEDSLSEELEAEKVRTEHLHELNRKDLEEEPNMKIEK